MILKDEKFIQGIAEDEKRIKLTPEQMKVIIPDVEQKILNLLKDAKKIMKHSKRNYMKSSDLELATRSKLEEPLICFN